MNFSIIIYKNVSKLHFFWVYLLTNFSEQKNDFKLHDLVSKMSFFCVLGFSMNFSIIIYKNVSKLHFF
jgi:hypothetical protein